MTCVFSWRDCGSYPVPCTCKTGCRVGDEVVESPPVDVSETNQARCRSGNERSSGPFDRCRRGRRVVSAGPSRVTTLATLRTAFVTLDPPRFASSTPVPGLLAAQTGSMALAGLEQVRFGVGAPGELRAGHLSYRTRRDRGCKAWSMSDIKTCREDEMVRGGSGSRGLHLPGQGSRTPEADAATAVALTATAGALRSL